MKKKVIFISIIICVILAIIFTVLMVIKKKNALLEYRLEVVTEIDYMVFNENNKFGVINKNGDIVVEAKYDEIQIPNPSKPLFICMYNYDAEKKQYNIKVFNDKSEQILYQYVVVEAIKLNSGISQIPYEKSVLKYMDKGKYGLIDFDGKIIAKAKYDEISSFDFNEGLLIVKNDNKYGIININGATVIKEKYDAIESDGYYEEGQEYQKSGYITGIKEGNNIKYGYISRNRKQILKEKFDQIARIPNQEKNDDIYLITIENGKAGFYKNDKNIVKNEYEDIAYDSNNNCLILQKDSKQGIADLNGNVVIPIKYDNIYISGKYINAQDGKNMEIYDYSNKQKIELKNIVGLNQTTNDNLSIAITNEEKFMVFDNSSNELKDKQYEYLEYIYDDCFIAYSDKKFGVVDSNGNIIIDFKYDLIQKIPNSKLVQAKNLTKNTTDFLLKDELITSMKNAEIELFDKYIAVKSDTEIEYLNYQGKILENKELFEKELYAYTKDGKWGFINKNGDIVVDIQYDFVTELNEYGFAGVKKDGKWGVINSKGEEVIEPVYIIDSNKPNFVGKFYEMNLGYGEPYYVSENRNDNNVEREDKNV